MEDNNQGSTSPDESARPPKKQKRVVLPKNKRRFTAVIRTKKPSSTNAGEDEEPQAAAAPTSVTDRVISKRASRPPSVAELNAEIKRMHQQLQDAISQQSTLQRENETLKKRNKALSEAVQKARSDFRDHRKQTHASDKSNKQQIRELEISTEDAQVSAINYFQAQLEDERVSCHFYLCSLLLLLLSNLTFFVYRSSITVNCKCYNQQKIRRW
jgi:regulator of replication initiation timing